MIYKRSPLKMQKIIKLRRSSRQLLETVNFAFMKIFDFLVKIAVLGHLSFFWEIPVIHFLLDHMFNKSKIDGLQKLSTRAPRFYDFLHLKGGPFINHKISFYKIGKFCFLSLRSSSYIKIDRKTYIPWSDNFSVYFLGFQTV